MRIKRQNQEPSVQNNKPDLVTFLAENKDM